MTKWIRWPGLVAFAVIFGGIFVFFYFFAGAFIKGAIEEYGSEAVGAQVNVDSVKLTIDPLGFAIGRVQVTNPDEPMTNAVDISSTSFDVGFWNLFMGQFIINELSVDKLQFNTPRKSSGALAPKTAEELAEEAEPTILDEAAEELPSAKEILAKESLLTEQRSDEFQALYETRMKEIDAAKDGLADKAKVDAWKKEVKELTSGKLKSLEDFKQRKKRLSEINKEIKQEKEKISQAKALYSDSYKELKAKLKDVKDAPSQDLKNLKGKYSLDGSGATNVSKLLFGAEAGQWTETTLEWYAKVKPYLESSEDEEVQKVERKKGRYVHFGGVEPLPEFLLRRAHVDVLSQAGHIGATLKDATHQPEVLGRPAVLNVSGTELKGYESIYMDAEFNHVDSKNSFDKATFKINAMEVNDFSVSKDSSFKLKLAKAKSDIAGTAIIKDGQLDLDVNALFSSAQFESNASSGAARQIGELLEEIHHFTIEVMADGNLKDLDTSFDSSLDRQLKKAFHAKLDKKQAELEEEIKQKLQAKVSDKTAKYGSEVQGILTSEKGLDAKKDELENLAKSKLTSWEEQQKAELEAKKAEEKAKLEEKKRKEKARLEAKKKAERERARKKAEEAAKEKLKNLF